MGEQFMLTEAQVRQNASIQSFTRGLNYYNSGAIFDTIKRANTLEARCEGSDYQPYRVTATLGEQGVISTSCTCPYDWGGYCKHIIALLLAYVHEPTIFTRQTPHQETLEQKSKEELVALVLEMVDRYPDLAILLDRPQPTTHTRQTSVDTASYRRELRHAIDHYDGWGDYSAEDTLYRLNDTISGFVNVGDWQSASAICRALIEEALSDDGYQFDDEGDFLDALNIIANHLVEFAELPELADHPAEREAILKTTLDIILWDINQGGIGLGDELYDPFFEELATPEDLPYIEAQIEPLVAKKRASQYGKWGAEALENMLFELQIELSDADPDVLLARLYDGGFYALAVQKLIRWERITEAVDIIQKHLTNPYERLQAAQTLIAVGHPEKALPLVEESLAAAYDERLAALALELYQQQGDHEKAFAIQWQQMMNRPSVDRYTNLQKTAQRLDRWDETRTEIIKWLHENNLSTLTQIYLHEKDWDTAWATLQTLKENDAKSTRNYSYHWHSTRTLELEYAEKAYEDRPYRAIAIYEQVVHRLIGARGRKNYQTATRYLHTIRDIYRNLDEVAAWEALIENIREENRQLPALKDELNKAQL
ncbi:SWIM zinc finger domain-containing protein [Chloroflexota bacterium]